jgi:CTP:molybdopterin cytidylyltransferase MocA
VLAGLVLAGGGSSRMGGSPKAALKAPCGRSFAGRIIDVLTEAGVENLVVVTGEHHDAVVAAVTDDSPEKFPVFVRNPNPARGQLSSLWVGMDHVINADVQALLVTLVDVPMITVEVVRLVIDGWRATGAPIVRPAMGALHGHPVLYDRSLFAVLRSASLEQGAKSVVRAHESEILNVPVTDPGCLRDVDTPEDYKDLGRSS